MQDFKTWFGYVLAFGAFVWTVIKEFIHRKDTKALTAKSELDVSESLKIAYKEDALAWKEKFEEEKKNNQELIKRNQTLVDNILKEQEDKASYLEEIHKLRVEIGELRNIIVKFQAQFPDLFPVSDTN